MITPGQNAANCDCENPVYVALGPQAYGTVFEKTLEALHDSGFEILESNRYDGRIETMPRIAPGVAEFLKPGSPVIGERVLASFQTYRHRASVKIQPADNGGFFIQVLVFKELEDLPRPVRSTVGAAVFRTQNNVERQVDIVDPTVYEANWIPRGRDLSMEQQILRTLQKNL